MLRLLTAAFWQAGNLPAAARAVRDWARVDTDRPTPERFASRIYEDMGAFDLAADAAERAADRAPGDASAWERLGRLRLQLMDRRAAIIALERARLMGPTVEGLLDLALAYHLAGDVGRRGVRGARRHADRAGLAGGVVDLRPRAGPDRPAAGMHRGVPAGADAGRGSRGGRALGARRGDGAARDLGADRGVGAPSGRARGRRRARRRAQGEATEPSRPHTGQDSLGSSARPPHSGQFSTCSSTPSSSPTRHTSSRSSSTSIHAPAEAGKTT